MARLHALVSLSTPVNRLASHSSTQLAGRQRRMYFLSRRSLTIFMTPLSDGVPGQTCISDTRDRGGTWSITVAVCCRHSCSVPQEHSSPPPLPPCLSPQGESATGTTATPGFETPALRWTPSGSLPALMRRAGSSPGWPAQLLPRSVEALICRLCSESVASAI